MFHVLPYYCICISFLCSFEKNYITFYFLFFCPNLVFFSVFAFFFNHFLCFSYKLVYCPLVLLRCIQSFFLFFFSLLWFKIFEISRFQIKKKSYIDYLFWCTGSIYGMFFTMCSAPTIFFFFFADPVPRRASDCYRRPGREGHAAAEGRSAEPRYDAREWSRAG